MATKEKIPGRGMLLTSFGWIAILLSYFGTFALGLILPYMCEEMGLDSVSLGSSLSSLAFLVKVIVYIPLAMFAARANPKYFLAIVYIMLGGSLILHGMANSVTGLYIGRRVSKFLKTKQTFIFPPLQCVLSTRRCPAPLSTTFDIQGRIGSAPDACLLPPVFRDP